MMGLPFPHFVQFTLIVFLPSFPVSLPPLPPPVPELLGELKSANGLYKRAHTYTLVLRAVPTPSSPVTVTDGNDSSSVMTADVGDSNKTMKFTGERPENI